MMHVRHKDKLRLDAIEDELLIIHPPAPSDDAFDGLWVICDYTLPSQTNFLSRHKNLRRAIDMALGWHDDGKR